MANHLNIDFTNGFGNDKDYYFIDDPIVYVREAGATTDPVAIGYTKIGKNFSVKTERAKVYCGIPQSLVRNDPIKQDVEFSCDLYQFSPENFALALNRTIDTSTGSVTRVVIGSNIPNALDFNVAVIGRDVEGKYVGIYIRRLNVSADDVTLALGATEHGAIALKGACMIDENPAVNSYQWEYDATVDNDDIAFIKFTGALVAQP
jgi:hypothetical protein